MTYECEICKKTFKYPSLLKAHQKRKTPCVFLSSEEVLAKTLNKCIHCGKTYSTSKNLQKHINVVCGSKAKHDAASITAENITNANVVNTTNNTNNNNTTNNFDIKVVVNPPRYGWKFGFKEPNVVNDFPKVVISLEIIQILYDNISKEDVQKLYGGNKGTAMKIYSRLLELIYEQEHNINIMLNFKMQNQVFTLNLNRWAEELLVSTVGCITPAVIHELRNRGRFLPKGVPQEFVQQLTTQIATITDEEFKREITKQLFSIKQTVETCNYGYVMKNLTNRNSSNLCVYDDPDYSKLTVIPFISRLKEQISIRKQANLEAAINNERQYPCRKSALLSISLKTLMLFIMDEPQNMYFVPMGDYAYTFTATGWQKMTINEGLALVLPVLMRILLLILDSGEALFYNMLGAYLREVFDEQLANEVKLAEVAKVYTDFIYFTHLDDMRRTPSFPIEAIEYYDANRCAYEGDCPGAYVNGKF